MLARNEGAFTLTLPSHREIVPPVLLVHTEEYLTLGFTNDEMMVTVTFTERAGKTTLTRTTPQASRVDRDGRVRAGIEAGAAEVLVHFT